MSAIKQVLSHNQNLRCPGGGWGAGTVDCFAAIKAGEKNQQVMCVEKGYVGRGGCRPFATGAINTCYPDDDKDLWFEETVTKGEYLNDPE